MKRLIIGFFLTIIIAVQAEAQLLVLKDMNGKPIPLTKYVNVNGSPFLSDEWRVGEVTFENNSMMKDISLKYDQVEDQIYFKGINNEIMAFNMRVKEFKLYPSENKEVYRHFVSGFPEIKGTTATTFYEIVVNGKVQLIKRSRKTISETKEYSSATTNKNIQESNNYFLYKAGQLNPVKKDKKSILAALPDKSKELEDYIKSNNLNLKQDADLSKVIAFYNSL